MKEEHMHTLIPLNWSAKLLMKQLIIETICNCKFHWTAEMTLFILELFGWDRQHHNLQELFLTLVLNTLLSPLFFAMMKQPEITSSRNMILFKAALSKEIKCIEDARLWPTTCTSLTQIKSYQRLVQNWLMVQQNFKVSSGKTTLAYRPSKVEHNQVFNLNSNSNKISALSSNFWPFISHKVLATIQMVF